MCSSNLLSDDGISDANGSWQTQQIAWIHQVQRSLPLPQATC